MTPTPAAAREPFWRGRARRLRSRFLTMVGRLMTDDGRVDRVRAGRLLLLMQGVFIDATAPLLEPDRRGWIALGAVAVAMSLLLVLSFRLGLARVGFCTGAVYPMSTMIALGVLGLSSPGTFAPLAGYLTLSFVYIGLTQRPRAGLTMVPAGLGALALSYGSLEPAILVRMIVTGTAWVATAGVLAWLTARNVHATSALRGAARLDTLTGVPNRSDLDRRLGAAVPGDTLVICDLDHFKRINDTHGHAGGDRVLADFGALLRAELRTLDYCARFGGEEFVLILAGAGRSGHRSVIERLHRSWALMQPEFTFSTGAAVCATGRSVAETLALADEALYAAKADGRDTDRVAGNLPASLGRVASRRIVA